MHSLTSSISPKRGDTFIGEYGAILDGTGWSTSDDTQAAFRAHNEDIDYVTIRNLVIRNMPHQGIHSFYWMSDHWTIEYNEIAYNKWGLEFAPDFTIRNNYIHHNVGNPSSSIPAERGGGYVGSSAHNTTFDSNEIAYNGPEQKVGAVYERDVPQQLRPSQSTRRHLVRHQHQWGRTHRRQPRGGQRTQRDFLRGQHRRHHPEQHGPAQCGRRGVYLHVPERPDLQQLARSQFRGHRIFPQLRALLSLGRMSRTMRRTTNTVVVGTQSYAYASAFSSTACTSAQLGPYLNGSKNLTFSRNTYSVPSATGRYLLWGGWKYWNEWQALGHDLDGSMSQ